MPHSSWVAWEVTHSCSHNLYNSHKQSLILLMFSKKKTWAIWQNNLDRLVWTLCYLVKIPSSQCESSWLRQELKFYEAFCPDNINNRSNIQNGYFRNSLLCSSVKHMFNLPVPNTHPVPLTLLGMWGWVYQTAGGPMSTGTHLAFDIFSFFKLQMLTKHNCSLIQYPH